MDIVISQNHNLNDLLESKLSNLMFNMGFKEHLFINTNKLGNITVHEY